MNERRTARTGLLGVALLFVLSGVVTQSIPPRYADLSAKLGLDPGALGVALSGATIGLAAVGTMFSLGVGERLGRRLLLGLPLALFCLSPMLVSIAGSEPSLFAVELFQGVVNAPLDLAENTLALSLSAVLGKALLPRLQIGYAVGALIGAGAAALTAHRVEVGTYLFAVGVAATVLGLVAWRFLPAETPTAAEPSVAAEEVEPGAEPASDRRMWGIALLAFSAILAQLVGQEWASVFYRDVLHAAPGQYGYGGLALQGGLVGALLIGRWLAERFGARRVVRVGGAIFTVAMAVFVISHSVAVATAALALAGFASGNPVWLAVAGVGGHPRVKLWAARVTAAMYLGRGASKLVGLLADAISLRRALLVSAIPVGIAVCAMASVLPGRRSGSAPGGGGAIA